MKNLDMSPLRSKESGDYPDLPVYLLKAWSVSSLAHEDYEAVCTSVCYVFAVKQFGRLSSVTILLYFKAANIGVTILNEKLKVHLD